MLAAANFIEKHFPFLLETNESSNIGISELPRAFFQDCLSPFTERLLSIVLRRPFAKIEPQQFTAIVAAEPNPSQAQAPRAPSNSIAAPAENAPTYNGIERERVIRDLCFDSEDYLRMGKETYNQMVQNLKTMVSESSAPAEEIAFLQKLLEDHGDLEKRLCLQYLTFEEQERVEMVSHSPLLQSVAKAISIGAWEELFDPKSDLATSDLSSLFIAAYHQKMIDLEDLATAMLFHRAFKNAKGGCKFLPIEPSHLETIYNLDYYQQMALLQGALDAKANQRYFVFVDFDSLDPWTKTLMFNTFLNGKHPDFIGFLAQRKPGTLALSWVGTPAFGVCRKLYPNLSPVIHLAPTMEAMTGHIRNGHSDYVLHFPDEVAIVHGSQDKTIFAQVHDIFHTFARNQRAFMQEQMFAIADHFPPDHALRETYTKKMDNGLDKLCPRFITKPTEEEVVSYLKDRIVGEVVDGGYSANLSLNSVVNIAFEAFIKIVKSVLETELPYLSCAFDFDDAFEWRVCERFRKALQPT